MRPSVHPRHGFLEGVGRIRLHYRAWEQDEPRAVILLLHGIFEHSRRYEELAVFMAGAGLSTYALDLRGHGASEGRGGYVRRFEILLQDVDRFRREVQGLAPPGVPVFLVAHSMGGLIALRYLQEYETTIAGAVISAPWLGTAAPLPRWLIVAANLLDRVLPAFPIPYRIDHSLLSHDPERVADYRDDPEIHGTATPRLFTETSSAIHLALQRGHRLDVPVLFLIPGDDRLVDTQRSLAIVRALPSRYVTIHVVEGAFHELFQERERRDSMARARDWILERLNALPNRQGEAASPLHGADPDSVDPTEDRESDEGRD
jgi:alpha-beta hydrolase superfamily lysophospholipase